MYHDICLLIGFFIGKIMNYLYGCFISLIIDIKYLFLEV